MDGDDPAEKPEASGVARPGLRISFEQAEAQAREVLRAKGYSEEQIDNELKRPKRELLD